MSLFVSLLAAPAAAAPAKPAARAPQTLQISGDDVEAIFGREYDECASFEQAAFGRGDSIAEKILSRTKEFQGFNFDQRKAAVEYLGREIRAAVTGKTFHDLLVSNQTRHNWECHSGYWFSLLTQPSRMRMDIFDLKVPAQELTNAIAEGMKIQPAAPAPYQPPLPVMEQINPASIPADSEPVQVIIPGDYPAGTSLKISVTESDRSCFNAVSSAAVVVNQVRFQIDPKGLGGKTCEFIAENAAGKASQTLQITRAGRSAPAPRVTRPAPARPAPAAPAPRPAAPPPPAPAPAKPKPATAPTPPPPPAPVPAPATPSAPSLPACTGPAAAALRRAGKCK